MKEEYVGYYKRMVIKANKEVVSPIEACMLDKKEALKKQAEEIKGWMGFFHIELTEGQERDYKQRFLKQGGKGIKPKENGIY